MEAIPERQEMNRYTLEGIVSDLIHGKHLIITAPTTWQAQYWFYHIAQELRDNPSIKIRVAHNSEEITSKHGGRLYFTRLDHARCFRTSTTLVIAHSDEMKERQKDGLWILERNAEVIRA